MWEVLACGSCTVAAFQASVRTARRPLARMFRPDGRGRDLGPGGVEHQGQLISSGALFFLAEQRGHCLGKLLGTDSPRRRARRAAPTVERCPGDLQRPA